jgi:hypothetical protein
MTIKALGWNQDVVLGTAEKGYTIVFAAPGRSNMIDEHNRFHWTRKTVESLLNAGLLAGDEINGFTITVAGREAYKKLPRKSN